jgi:hypothetical protein
MILLLPDVTVLLTDDGEGNFFRAIRREHLHLPARSPGVAQKRPGVNWKVYTSTGCVTKGFVAQLVASVPD